MSVLVAILAGLGFVLSVTFVALYARRPWWASNTGRVLMSLVAVLGLVFGLRLANLTIATIPDWVWAVGYLVLDAGLVGLLWLLLGDERSPPPNGRGEEPTSG